MEKKEQITLAKQIIDNKELHDFIFDLLLTEDKLTDEYYQNKNDEELGQFVRAQWLAKKMIIERYSKLKQLAQAGTERKGNPNVPK